MADQQPGEAEFAEAWPALRERWLSEGLPIEQFVRAAYLDGFAARSGQLMRLAYNPVVYDEPRDEPRTRWQGPVSVTGRSYRPPAMQYFRPEYLPEPLPMDGPGRLRNPGETDHRYLPDPEPYTGQPTREDTRILPAVEADAPADPGHEDGKGAGNAS